MNSQNSITCVNKCSCEDINPTTDILQVFGPATNCCDVVSTGARGNVVISGTGIECTLCPSLCDTVCELSEVNVSSLIVSINSGSKWLSFARTVAVRYELVRLAHTNYANSTKVDQVSTDRLLRQCIL